MRRTAISRVRSPASSSAQTLRMSRAGHAGVVEAAGALEVGPVSTRARISARGLGCGVAAQFLEGNGGDFDVDIDAVEQGAADLAEIVLDLTGSAAAFAGGIAVEAAFTPVHVATALLRRSTGCR